MKKTESIGKEIKGVSREIEDIRKTPMEILKIKNTVEKSIPKDYIGITPFI